MTLNERLSTWVIEHQLYLTRAAEQARYDVTAFIDDWSGDDFKVELPPEIRVKSTSRLLEKLERKGIEDPDELLEAPWPVRDLIGARIVVRGLADYESIGDAIGANLPWKIVVIDDKRATPSVTGYRALHCDCLISVNVRGSALSVPVELQVKTLAQKIWGEYTHDSAYAMGATSGDARFQVVRSMQESLARHLDLVDELQALITRLSADVVVGIATEPASDLISVPSLLNFFYRDYELLTPLATAQHLTELCKLHQIGSIESIRILLAQESDAAVELSQQWRAAHAGRAPTPAELAVVLLEATEARASTASSPSGS